jgi:sulfur carrier protein ThiS
LKGCIRSGWKWRRRVRADGICWFTDGAREAIARAFTLAALLRECGVPVTKVATHRPGQILYRDDYQIVAKPDEATPTVWH